ncbi:membrane dipeptidase [uncultured Cohaesibacter sp.]|uniref:membrane dipeptidase n=1 Tax=uncultured Cohaesibacter sp. TaxID=1002546 RepID=UPI0029C85F58|nr:membrane dipeptidase [uncultured Cohaesibacter sp.]
MTEAQALHEEAILIDGLNICNWDREIFEEYRKGGVTAVSCTAAVWENFRDGMLEVSKWLNWYEEHSDIIMPVHSTADILEAKKQNKTGIILNWQNTSPLEDRLQFVPLFKKLGVGVMQLTYNTQNYAGSGYLESNDSGLSDWGKELIDAMGEWGVLCDLSHVGDKTSADVVAYSKKPVAFTHVLPRGLLDKPRNKSDELMQAVAGTGGIVGFSLFAPGMKNGNDSTIDDVVEAICYMVDLLGEDHVTVGTDFSLKHPRPGPFLEWCNMDKGDARWLTQFGSKPVNKPKGIERIKEFPNLTEALLKVGFSHERIKKIYGENWLRVLRQVWEGEK